MAIRKCTCKCEGQDKIHGKDNRVFNETGGEVKTNRKLRCTVCGKEI